VCSCNHCCCCRALSITYSERVSVALVTQHTKHTNRIILLYVSSSIRLSLHRLTQNEEISANNSSTQCILLIMHVAVPQKVKQIKMAKLYMNMPRKDTGEAEVQFHWYLTSELDGDQWSPSCPQPLYPHIRPTA